MKGIWQHLDSRRRRGVVAALAFVGVVEGACVPHLWASLDGEEAATGAGQRSVMMLENRHSALRDYAPAPVAGSIEVSVREGDEGERSIVVAYRDHWREELARGVGTLDADGHVTIELEQENEAARPWWRCRSVDVSPCTAYAVERKTLRVDATLEDGVLLVHSLVAGSAHVIRERADGQRHDDEARWTRYELSEEIEIALDEPAPPVS